MKTDQHFLLEDEQVQAPTKVNRPVTPPPKLKEAFGDANTTPSSSFYTTYLPAQQLHSLLTAPEAPEKIRRSIPPLQDLDYFNEPLPGISFSPSPLQLARKPLLKTKTQEIGI
jgi:hypothetical protein